MPKKRIAETGAVKKKKVTRRRTVAKTEIPAAPSTPSLAHGHAVHHPSLHIPASVARRQRLIMTFSIAAIMALLTVGWILNLRHVIGEQVEAAPKSADTNPQFQDLKQELSDSLKEVRSQLDQLNEIKEELVTATATPSVTPTAAPTSSAAPAVLPQ